MKIYGEEDKGILVISILAEIIFTPKVSYKDYVCTFEKSRTELVIQANHKDDFALYSNINNQLG